MQRFQVSMATSVLTIRHIAGAISIEELEGKGVHGIRRSQQRLKGLKFRKGNEAERREEAENQPQKNTESQTSDADYSPPLL